MPPPFTIVVNDCCSRAGILFSPPSMRGSREMKKQRTQLKRCNAFCCSCSRLSVSSSEGVEGSSSSDRLPTISSLAHAMVQERLDQMIRERFVQSRNEGRRRESRGYGDGNSGGTKCIVMVAMDKYSYDPRKDFRDSMVEMITANQIEDPKDLRCLLNCYVSMNSSEYKPLILQVFHEVCCNLFLRCKYHY